MQNKVKVHPGRSHKEFSRTCLSSRHRLSSRIVQTSLKSLNNDEQCSCAFRMTAANDNSQNSPLNQTCEPPL
ncbi:hypothetical protein Hanom_Chr10g00922021 [Helianthus anomalus]